MLNNRAPNVIIWQQNSIALISPEEVKQKLISSTLISSQDDLPLLRRKPIYCWNLITCWTSTRTDEGMSYSMYEMVYGHSNELPIGCYIKRYSPNLTVVDLLHWIAGHSLKRRQVLASCQLQPSGIASSVLKDIIYDLGGFGSMKTWASYCILQRCKTVRLRNHHKPIDAGA